MIADVLLVLGVFVMSLALRTVRNPVIHKLGTLGIVVTSFLAGWLFSGQVWVGFAFVSLWFLLPWLEILTRVRRMRIPLHRTLEERTPPTRADFPNLSELTQSVESAGFEYLDDVGWEWDRYRQFFRLFSLEPDRMQAAICLIEQDELAFFYLSISSRLPDGTVFMTWNYPFSYGLKSPPTLRMNRVPGELDFQELLREHRQFLSDNGVDQAETLLPTAEAVRSEMEDDIRKQMRFNLDHGLLKQEGKDLIRYSARGMLFLWLQFLRDFVRLS